MNLFRNMKRAHTSQFESADGSLKPAWKSLSELAKRSDPVLLFVPKKGLLPL